MGLLCFRCFIWITRSAKFKISRLSEIVSHVVSLIVKQTYKYSFQLRAKFHTGRNEINDYIGELKKMGLVRMPSYAMY